LLSFIAFDIPGLLFLFLLQIALVAAVVAGNHAELDIAHAVDHPL
jgi:hypothetical protein